MTWAEELSDDGYGKRQVRAIETYLSLAPWRAELDQRWQVLLTLFHANRKYGDGVSRATLEQVTSLIQFVAVLDGISESEQEKGTSEASEG